MSSPPRLAHDRADDEVGELGHYAYVRTELDAFELNDPRQRGRERRRSLDQRVRMHLHAYFSHVGTLPGDWPALGFQAPPEGRVYICLHMSGETLPLLQTRTVKGASEFDYYLRVHGLLFKLLTLQKQATSVAWPWRVVPWSDRNSASQLLDRVLSLWPRRADGTFGRMLEPMRATSIHIAGASFGLGLNPVFAGHDDRKEFVPRHADALASTLPTRGVDKTDAERPALLLWSPEGVHVDSSTTVFNRVETDEGWRTNKLDAFASVRVCLPDPDGTHPDVHLLTNMTGWQRHALVKEGRATLSALPPASFDLTVWCPRCFAEEEVQVRAVAGGLCKVHYERQTNVVKGLSGLTCPKSPYGTHRYAKNRKAVGASCRYCGALSDEALRRNASPVAPGTRRHASLPAAGIVPLDTPETDY